MSSMSREAWSRLVLVLGTVQGSATAQEPAPTLPSTPYVEVLQVVPLEPTPVGSRITADYLAQVLAILDACARSPPPSALPFAGRARLVLQLSTRASVIEVVDLEPGLVGLRERCLASAPPLPPLRMVPTFPGYAPPTDVGRIYVDLRIDARGVGSTPGEARPGTGTTIDLLVDTASLVLDHYDARLRPEELRDDLIRGLEPYRSALGRCVETDARRRRGPPAASELALRIDRNGSVREVESDGHGVLAACLRSVLVGRRLAPWRSATETRLRVTIRPRR